MPPSNADILPRVTSSDQPAAEVGSADRQTTRVLVLGASGMLGSMIVTVLARDERLRVTATVRSDAAIGMWSTRLDGVDWALFDGNNVDIVAGYDWIVNAVGVIKPLIHEDNAAEVENAIRVNALLPHRLAEAAGRSDARILQIATDCVYSGSKGAYAEDDPHDALDVYGKTKSLGEVCSPNAFHVRSSIVGPEAGQARSLLEWFRGQPRDATLSGFVNHRWNGVTTLHFARVCLGVVVGAATPPAAQHLVPMGVITKYDLLRCFAEEFERGDLSITPVDATTVIDRTLATKNEDANRALWTAAGYDRPPTVPEMIAELAEYDYAGTTAARIRGGAAI
jgi:dTDP-4-dehydrorhamnose reductase